MDEYETDHGVKWGKPYYKAMAYQPDIDVLLYTATKKSQP